jgi:hypothetical protein
MKEYKKILVAVELIPNNDAELITRAQDMIQLWLL